LSRFALATAEVATAAATATEITASDDATKHDKGLKQSAVSSVKHFICTHLQSTEEITVRFYESFQFI
jgi:hypothetical protein